MLKMKHARELLPGDMKQRDNMKIEVNNFLAKAED